MLGLLRPGPGREAEDRPVPQIDPDPAVVGELVAEEPADLAERRQAGQVAQDRIDLQERGRALRRTDRNRGSRPSKAGGSAEGENLRRVGSADLGL